MDILGIGFSELIFILVIALMVFGPRRLPEMAGKAGKFIADLRSMSNGLMAEWQREINASELQDELDKTRQELAQARDTVSGAGRQVKEETASVAKSIAPPKIDAGKVLSDQAANLEEAATSTPSTVQPSPEESTSQNSDEPTPEKLASTPEPPVTSNGTEVTPPVHSSDSEKMLNE
jgi:sec-independent protein translocase protein TatB